MRRVLLALALTCFSGAAHAQVQSVPWALEQPTDEDYRLTYPAGAMADGVEGVVRLLCLIREDRRLECTVQSETPEGHGFGAAAIALSQRYVVRREQEDARLVAGRRVIVPIEYRLK